MIFELNFIFNMQISFVFLTNTLAEEQTLGFIFNFTAFFLWFCVKISHVFSFPISNLLINEVLLI